MSENMLEGTEPLRLVDWRELEESRLGGLGPLVQSIAEGWGDIVDQREWQYDTADFGLGRAGQQVVYTSRNDRLDGKFLPVFQHERDLAAIRAEARNATAFSTCIQGALDTLGNYTLGRGLTFTVQKVKGCPADLEEFARRVAGECQRIVDKFLQDNWFTAGLDREIHHRSREDGEAFIWVRMSPNGSVKAQMLEPDQICEPADPRQLEEWLTEDGMCDCDSFVSSWSFGVHTAAEWPEEPLGYHVVRDLAGQDWDYLPEDQVVHVKRNVPFAVKRGVSDLYWVANDVQREAKLTKNLAEGAALQAAIAWIREFAQGASPSGVQSVTSAQAVMERQQAAAWGGSRTIRQAKYNSGSILNVPQGMTYKAGPMGSERNPNFLLVAAHVLRRMAQRWAMPEYLISSDASNANYASTLVAEAPFVKAREFDQLFYGEHCRRLMWRVLKLAWETGKICAGKFRALDEIQALVDVQVGYPQVATRDELQMVQVQEKQMQLGYLSARTACEEAGRDFDQEVERGVKGMD